MRNLKRIAAIVLCVCMMMSSNMISYATDSQEQTTPEQTTQEQAVQEQANTEQQEQNDNEQQEQAAQEPEAEETVKNAEEEVDFIYVDEKTVHIPGEQNLVVSLKDTNDETISGASLTLENQDGEEVVVESTTIVDSAVLFNIQYTDASEIGTYLLKTVDYTLEGSEDAFEMSLVEGTEFYSYTVTDEEESEEDAAASMYENAASGDDGVTVYSLDDADSVVASSNESAEDAVEDTLSQVDAQAAARTDEESTYSTQSAGNLVVAICAGHDGTHIGAAANGLKEEVLTLKVAQYMKAELEQYSGVTVVMIRNDASCKHPSDRSACLKQRIDDANAKGADLFVDIHFNSATSTTAQGAEIYYPNETYSPSISSEGKTVADAILAQLVSLGLTNRGSKIRNADSPTSSGAYEDYYYTNKYCKQLGFPGLIVEHEFISNPTQAEKLKSESFLQQLGVADATGVAKAYGLTKGSTSDPITVSPTSQGVVGNTVTVTIDKSKIGSSYTQFQFLYYDGSSWNTFRTYSTSNTATFTPSKANNYYMFAVYAKTSSSAASSTTFSTSYHYKVVNPTINVTGMTISRSGSSFTITPQVSTNTSTSNLVYTYGVQDDVNNKWTTIATDTTSATGKFTPTAGGQHRPYVKVSAKSGSASGEFMMYYTVNSVYLDGITASAVDANGQITITPNAVTFTTGTKYDYLVYDMSTWSALAYGSSSSSMKWSPKKTGQHLLHVKATGKDGRTSVSEQFVTVSSSASISKFTTSVSSPQKAGTSITLSGRASNALSGTQFRYIYNDGTTWYNIHSSSTQQDVTWKPTKAGNYSLCYQLILPGGTTLNKFINYTITSGVSTSVSSMSVGSMNSSGQMTITANANSNDTNLKYNYLIYDMNTWKALVYGSASKTQSWTPAKEGQHLVRVEVKGDSGTSAYREQLVTVSDSGSITGFSTSAASPQKAGTSITLTGNASTKMNGTQYRYIYFDGSTWRNISSGKTQTTAVWKPTAAGTYQLCYQVILPGGRTLNRFINYTITDGVSTGVSSISTSSMNSSGQITITANASSNDTNLKYNYLIYDMNTWKALAYGSSSKTQAWTPEKEGQHLVRVEVKGDSGKTAVREQMVTISDSGSITAFKASVASPQKAGTSITLTGSASTKMSGTQYRYIYFDGSTWRNISSGKTQTTATWKPTAAGTYQLCYQVILPGGRTLNNFINYTITTGTSYSSSISSISTSSLNTSGQITITANVSSNDSNLKYNYLIYDMNTWKALAYGSTSKTQTWTPEKEGQHLVRVELAGSNTTAVKEQLVTVTDSSAAVSSFKTSVPTPQKAGTSITLTASATHRMKGAYSRFIINNGSTWVQLGAVNATTYTWKPTTNGSYTLCYQIILPGGRNINSFISYNIKDMTEIMGKSTATVSQLQKLFLANNSSYPSSALGAGGASTLAAFCQMYIEEAEAEGVRADIAFAQAMIETGYLKFGGDVKIEQFNFAGLGATGGGVPGNSFPNVRTGIRAQIQHLKCYASTEPLKNTNVDPRWSESLRGKAIYVEYLSIPNNPYGTGWAADANYASKILNIVNAIYSY